MKFTAAVIAALAAVASALPAFTNTEFDFQEGKPITLTWSGATGPVNIQILSGPNKDSLVPVSTIASGLTGTSFTYTPTGLPSGNYAFKIVQPSTNEENYSILLPYVGTGSSSSLTTRTTTGTTTRTTSASSTSTDDESSTSTGTSTTTTSTRSATTTTTAATTRATTTPVNNNEGQRASSSLALVFITVAALFFFN